MVVQVVGGVYYVGAFAFTSLAAAYAFIKSGELRDTVTDAYNYVTGNETELTTLEELGYGEVTEKKDWSKSYYNGSDATTSDIKANKKYVETQSNHRNVFTGEQTIPVDQPVLKLDEKSFEAPEIKSQLNDLVKLEDQKNIMIKNKEWDKLPTQNKTVYNNQIAQKEQSIANHIRQVNAPVKPNGVEITQKTAPVVNTKTYNGSVTQKTVPVVETKPLVNAPNVKESLAINQAAGQTASVKTGVIPEQKTFTDRNRLAAENGAVAQSTTATPEYGNTQPPPGFLETPVQIDDNKEVSVGETGESDVVEGTKTAQKKRKQKTVMSTRNIGENILYGLEPSTYEFQLSAMTKNQYATGNFSGFADRRIVLKTSGLPKRSFELAPGSQLNYHVRNMQLNSTIGLNSATVTSNVHNMEFTVLEPFGASLLDDLHDAAVDAGHSNYLQGIYLLKLKFYGMDDEGKPSDSGVEKYFPLKIVNCQFNVTGGGTEYNFTAVPYNANALTDNRAKIDQPINIKGATVGELLYNLQDQLNEQPKIKTNGEGYDLKIVGKPFKYGTTPGQEDSEIEGYNVGLYDVPQTQTGKVPFSDILLTGGGADSKLAIELFKSTMNHDAFSSSANKVTFELNEEGKLIKEELRAKGAGQIKFNDQYATRVYTYNAGTPVLSIIQAIIDSSDYIMRQFKTDETMNVDVNAYGEVPWYKIDYKWITANKSKTPNKFIVRPYWVDQYVALPNSDPSVKINVKEVAREYDYIYTGKNRDILNFDLQYNFAFFAATAAQDDKTPGGTNNKLTKSEVLTKKYGTGESEEGDKAVDKGLAVVETKITDTDARAETQGGELGAVPGYKTASIIKKQLSDPQADLINLELDILGDPYYLVQEDFNPNVFPRSEANAYELEDGSIDANNGQVYVRVNFKTPTDIDDETGLMAGLQGSGKYDTSFFGGFYRLISVASNFEEGRFTQQLGMVRCRHQELEQPKAQETGMTNGVAGGQAVAPASADTFQTGSETQVDTPTEATIRSGLYINNIIRNLGINSGGTTSTATASTNSGGTENEQRDYSNNADNVLASNNDGTHTQTNTVTGLVTGNSFGGQMITQDNKLLSGYGREVGSTIGPGGASVASSTTVTQVGNRTVTETTEIDGNKKVKKVTQETTTGGEVTEVISEEKTSGTDKYGGLTKEEYYEGKSNPTLDQSTGVTFVTVSTADAAFRGGKRVENECLDAGGGKHECRKKKIDWKVENGYLEKKKSKTGSGRDIYTPTYDTFERTKVAR